MKALLELLDHPFAHRLGWALLHSLWQGALVAVLFGLLRFALRRASANARYLAGCICLTLLLAAPAATWLLLGTTADASARRHPIHLANAAPANLASGAPAVGHDPRAWRFIYRSAEILERFTPALVGAWFLGVALLSLRLLKGCWRVKTLRTQGNAPLDADWIERLNDLRRRLKISRPVRLLKSALVEVPTVIGWLRPVVLLPASTLAGLTPSQLEAVLAHELAHICRHDYLVNVFQNVVETLMFYHPAVWWISRCIREEREHCCDDLVVEVCGNRIAYARALATMEELRGEAPQLAFAASGGSLLARVRRLLGLPAATEPAGWRQAGGLALAGMGLLFVIAGVCLMLVPARYRALARIKVEHDTPHQIEEKDGKLTFSYDLNAFQTELAIIHSPLVLGRVIEDLNLQETWGKRFAGGRKLSAEEALRLLMASTSVQQLRNTSLVNIEVSNDDPAEAAHIANAIADIYKQYRVQSQLDLVVNGIEALEKRWEEHSAKLQEVQRNLDALRLQLRIADPDPQSTAPTPRITADVLREYLKTLTTFRTAEANQQAQIDALRKLDRNQLREAIQTALQQPDAALATLFNELDLAEQRLQSMSPDLTPENPRYKNAKEAIADLNAKIDRKVDGILVGLQNRLEQTRASIAVINQQFESAKSNDLAIAELTRPYYANKRQLAEQLQFRTELGKKIAAEKTDLILPRKSLVSIVESAQRPSEPVSPRRILATAFILCGLLLGIVGLLMLKGKPAPAAALSPA